MSQKLLYLLTLLAFTIVVVLGLFDYYDVVNIPVQVHLVARWLTLLLLIGIAYRRRSLTTWIVVSMFVGLEIGFTFP
ncbi:MAG TPA: dicarboxylate/amino acid:cation symporter, partial [Chryseosolibacter sp.]|nr:dicarboxylate/amino acid:cation symporter [Chryseosolibacter sp.]